MVTSLYQSPAFSKKEDKGEKLEGKHHHQPNKIGPFLSMHRSILIVLDRGKGSFEASLGKKRVDNKYPYAYNFLLTGGGGEALTILE